MMKTQKESVLDYQLMRKRTGHGDWQPEIKTLISTGGSGNFLSWDMLMLPKIVNFLEVVPLPPIPS